MTGWRCSSARCSSRTSAAGTWPSCSTTKTRKSLPGRRRSRPAPPFGRPYAGGTVDDMFQQLKAIFVLARRKRALTGVVENPCDEYARLAVPGRPRVKREGSWTPEKIARAYALDL